MLEFIGMSLIVTLAGLGGWLIGSDWRKKNPKGRKPEYPTREMRENFYRTGDINYLCRKDYKR